ncbi:MAG: PHP domain-containing protein [Acidobacteria bacterium]|nr:PHP domain-containing protein [Acidobacteriota bacterium]
MSHGLLRLVILSIIISTILSLSPRLEAAAHARRITDNSELAKGKQAQGAIGDFLLVNESIKIIIDDVRKRHGFAESGGNILDAASLPENVDALGQIFTFFGNEYPRQARYDRLEITHNGADGQAAVIRVFGADARDPFIKVTTDYRLEPGATHVQLTTTLTNSGTQTIPDFAVGDVIQWGRAQRFAPGHGREGAGRTLNLQWVAGLAENVSYGYFTAQGAISGPQGSNWSDFNVAKLSLAPGQSQTYSRYFAVGRGDVSSVSDVIFRLRHVETGLVKGAVVEAVTSAKVSGASIKIEQDGKPYSTILGRPDGTYSAWLPLGAYRLSATGYGRSGSTIRRLSLSRGQESIQDFALSKQGHVDFTIVDRISGRRLPAKLTFRGLGTTPDPDFGPAYQIPAANVVFSHTGNGSVILPPGLYEVTASRGIEYTIDRARLAVGADRPGAVHARLERVVNTTGYIAGDFHLHAENSPDSNISLRDKVIDLVAEGIEFAVATDHNYLTDYSKAIKDLQLESELKSTVGNEVTVSGKFHFNAFPLALQTGKPGQGAVAVLGKTPQQLFDEIRQNPGEEVIQINHPRAGSIGYFDTFKLDTDSGKSADPNYSDKFDAIEVFNGKRIFDAERVLQDWFNLLNRGYVYTATGNSDSHQIVGEEAGYPRNLVWVGKDNPADVRADEIVEAVRRHRIVVTNGPFIEFSAGPNFPMGSTVPGRRTAVTFDIKVQSAPWVDVAEVTLIGNGEVVERFLVDATASAIKFQRSIAVHPTRDTWYVVVVRGNTALAPVIPSDGGHEVTPLAFTNPIWIDVDGDGRFDPVIR